MGDGQPRFLLPYVPAAKGNSNKNASFSEGIKSQLEKCLFKSKPEQKVLVICCAAATAAQLLL